MSQITTDNLEKMQLEYALLDELSLKMSKLIESLSILKVNLQLNPLDPQKIEELIKNYIQNQYEFDQAFKKSEKFTMSQLNQLFPQVKMPLLLLKPKLVAQQNLTDIVDWISFRHTTLSESKKILDINQESAIRTN